MLTECSIEVRYPDCDAMGIVHHAVYPVWYEIARMDFFSKIGFSYTDMSSRGINPPMVNLNLQYLAPVRYPGTVTIRTTSSLCAGKKLELKYAVYYGDRTTPVATATSFHIWTGPDMKSLDMRTLPETYEKLSGAVPVPAVLILAGGKSTRMGSDKAKSEIDGKSMLQRAVDFWRSVLPDSKIYAAVGHSDHFTHLPEGVTAIADLIADCGPMGGLHAAFHTTGAELLAVSAVDMPLLTRDALNALFSKRTCCEDICVYTHDGKPEPLFGFYRSSCLPRIDAMLAAGNYRMTQLVADSKSTLVKLADPTPVTNTNTPEELQQARTRLAQI